MSFKLFLGISVIPGILAAALVSQYYSYNRISRRYSFLPFDFLLERHISRKIMKTWGEKLRLKFETIESSDVEALWNAIKLKAGVKLPGNLFLLKTNEKIFNLLPTGDFFVSTGIVKDLNKEGIASLFAHELAHMQLQHAQENIGYSKLTCLAVGWLCRNNHHVTDRLKTYLLKARYSQLQEYEANVLAKDFSDNFTEFLCENSLKTAD